MLYPRLRKLVEWFVAHPLASFMVGVCFGIFLIDLCFSVHLGAVVAEKRPRRSTRPSMTPSTCRSCGIRCNRRGGFFRFVSIKPLTERIDAFDEFLHRRPGGANTGGQAVRLSAVRKKNAKKVEKRLTLSFRNLVYWYL